MTDKEQYVATADDRKSTIISALMEALDGRKLRLVEHEDHAELAIGYAHLHRRLSRAMTRALTALDRYQIGRNASKDRAPTSSLVETTDLFLDAVYRLEELNEFYEKDLGAYFPQLKESPHFGDYCKALSSYNKRWSILCNKPKHNHAYLVAVEGTYECGSWTAGFSMYARNDDVMAVDRRLHKQVEIFSFGANLRRILDNVIAMDVLAAGLVASLSDEPSCTPLQTYIVPLPYEEVLKSFLSRQTQLVAMPGEHCPAMIVEGSPQHPIAPGEGSLTAMFFFDFYGDNLKLRMPYGLGEFQMTLNLPRDGSRKPLTKYLRTVASNVKIEPKEVAPYPFNSLQLAYEYE